MQEYWEIYMKPVDGYPASIAFNAGIIEEPRKEALPYMGFIKLTMQEPNEKGFISEEEAPQLQFLEDSVESAILRYKVGNYVGKIITAGTVTFVFYLKYDFEWPDVVAFAFKDTEGYGYEFGSRMDSEWEIYHKLLEPDTYQWQIIRNHNSCDRLRASGDALDAARAIEHTVYFKASDAANAFTCKAEQEGFTCNAPEETEAGFKLLFYRQDRPYYYSIDALTLELMALAEAHEGVYDGWECSVVKHAPST